MDVPPTGTTGVSNEPFRIRFATAGVATTAARQIVRTRKIRIIRTAFDGERIKNLPNTSQATIREDVCGHNENPSSRLKTLAFLTERVKKSARGENFARIAEMLTRSALAREEPRGAHYRSDFPRQKLDWLKNIFMTPQPNGDFKTEYCEVQFTRLTPPELKEHRERAGLKTLPAIDDE